jgi:hypothetical protein
MAASFWKRNITKNTQESPSGFFPKTQWTFISGSVDWNRSLKYGPRFLVFYGRLLREDGEFLFLYDFRCGGIFLDRLDTSFGAVFGFVAFSAAGNRLTIGSNKSPAKFAFCISIQFEFSCLTKSTFILFYALQLLSGKYNWQRVALIGWL